MRTNINLTPDARELAELYAHANGITLGDAISDLIRQSGRAAAELGRKPRFGRSAAGFPTFQTSSQIITTEMVKEGLEDLI